MAVCARVSGAHNSNYIPKGFVTTCRNLTIIGSQDCSTCLTLWQPSQLSQGLTGRKSDLSRQEMVLLFSAVQSLKIRGGQDFASWNISLCSIPNQTVILRFDSLDFLPMVCIAICYGKGTSLNPHGDFKPAQLTSEHFTVYAEIRGFSVLPLYSSEMSLSPPLWSWTLSGRRRTKYSCLLWHAAGAVAPGMWWQTKRNRAKSGPFVSHYQLQCQTGELLLLPFRFAWRTASPDHGL